MKGIDAEIDRLYQLPLDAFTAERNALAKRAGSDGRRIRELVKPSVPAWAVNQLYWRDREEWDALIASAENLRRAHKAVLGGREGDVRAAGKVHDDAVESALKATLALLEHSSHPVTDATRQGVLNTLRALPAGDAAEPGRLSKTLQPGGFEMLAGLAVGGAAKPSRAARPGPSEPRDREPRRSPAPARPERQTKPDARAIAAARHEVASSERALREAEQAVRREEFESARTVREEARARDGVEKARETLARAQADLARAESALDDAREARESAEARVPKARDAVGSAQKRAASAAAALEKLTAVLKRS